MSNTTTKTKPVAAVERALAVLDAFLNAESTLTLAEVADRTGLYKSTILRLAQSLTEHGYLVRTPTGDFHVGPTPLRLANRFQNAIEPQEVILPILRELVAKTNESASYLVPQDDVRVCVYRIDSPQTLRDHGRPGDIAPLERGAAGRVFLAFREPLDPNLAGVREHLIAETHGELEAGMTGLASPVFGVAGEVVGIVSLTGPETRFDQTAVDRMQRELVSAALTLTSRLGGDPTPFHAVLAGPVSDG